MIRLRLSRFVHRNSRFAVACAMLPLVFLNGQTFIGCGCNGHFEAVCHCHCGNGCGDCCGQAGHVRAVQKRPPTSGRPTQANPSG